MWVTIRTNAAVYNGKLGLKIKNRAGMLYSNTSRGIKKMTYNNMGQPSTVKFTDGGELQYSYSVAAELTGVSTYAVLAGKRRPVKVSERSYCGDFVFEGDSLAYVNFPGGYFDGNGGAHYRHPDFQGNITMVTGQDGKIEQHTGYYPYGEPWHESAGQPYLYGGKERMRDGGLNDYDFSARRLNSALALWSTPDPLAFKNTHSNPYVYCSGNPIRYIDPTGCEVIFTNVSENDKRIIKDIIERATQGALEISFVKDEDKNEKLQFKKNEEKYDPENLSVQQSVYYIEVMCNDSKKIKIKNDNYDSAIKIGDTEKKTIDLNDIESLGEDGPANDIGALYHEMVEIYLGETQSKGRIKDHTDATQIEGNIVGVTVYPNRLIKNDRIEFKYNENGINKKILIKFDNLGRIFGKEEIKN